MLSFWEAQSFLETDVAIIGGGITGLSVAASIKERWPNREVTVYERSIFPYGASTRNAGFACFGSLTEIISDIDVMGAEASRELLFNRWIGLQITRKRLTDQAIGFEPLGGYELIEARHLEQINRIDEVNILVQDFFPNYIQELSFDAKIGLKEKLGTTLVSMQDEGQIDTGLLMKSLEGYVLSLGVKLRTGVRVDQVDPSADKFSISMLDQARGRLTIKSNEAIICTNAFVDAMNIDEDVRPGRGQVLITKPIDNLQFKGNLHIDEGFFYLRSVGKRLLFGGGRNMDIDREETTQFELNDDIQSALERKLANIVALDHPVEVDMRWAGIMAFGASKSPHVKYDQFGRILALKMSGMGIALAGQIGEMVADLIEDKNA